MELKKLLSEFREKVKAANGVKRFSSDAFADILGVNTERYKKWEQSTLPASEDDREKIKRFFGLSNLEDIPDNYLETFPKDRFILPIKFEATLPKRDIATGVEEKDELDKLVEQWSRLQNKTLSSKNTKKISEKQKENMNRFNTALIDLVNAMKEDK